MCFDSCDNLSILDVLIVNTLRRYAYLPDV